jgi:hypothetical protein
MCRRVVSKYGSTDHGPDIEIFMCEQPLAVRSDHLVPVALLSNKDHENKLPFCCEEWCGVGQGDGLCVVLGQVKSEMVAAPLD